MIVEAFEEDISLLSHMMLIRGFLMFAMYELNKYCDRSAQLRKSVSDVTSEIHKLGKEELETIVELEEEVVQAAECECCGLKEECTKEYISNIKNSYSGKWVCGLCSEAVKERLRNESTAIEEALNTHKNICQEFNTSRLNPKLSLTRAMRDMVKKSCEKRRNKLSSSSKTIIRSSSCVPRIDLDMN